MNYERLLREASLHGVDTYEKQMKNRIKGLYGANVIWINRTILTTDEKACILAEELGHYHTTTGNIIDQTYTTNRQQELKARMWAYNKLVPLNKIVKASNSGISNRHELAEFLGVTESFLESALKRYQEKYGLHVSVNEYTICFEPLGVFKRFE